jgi:Tfp pilus assembly protein PilW
MVSNVNDPGKTATLVYTRVDGNKVSETDTLVNENGTWKIDAQQLISTPTETLLAYCGALKNQDYQTAYNQLSTSAQAQETEAQFAANFKSVTVNDCTVSNVNDTAGTGQISYTLNGTSVGAFDYTLVDENNTWKINSEKQHA